MPRFTLAFLFDFFFWGFGLEVKKVCTTFWKAVAFVGSFFAMPQPLTTKKLVRFSFDTAALSERPALAVHIATISQIWNEIDAALASFATALLGGTSRAAIDAYLAINSDGSKKAALDALVRRALSKADKEKFAVIQAEVGKRYKERNDAVHGSWGTSPDHPDKLLWIDSRRIIHLSADMLQFPGEGKQAERDKLMMKAQRNIRIWTKKDFQNTEARMIKALDNLNDFIRPFILATYGPIKKTPS